MNYCERIELNGIEKKWNLMVNLLVKKKEKFENREKIFKFMQIL